MSTCIVDFSVYKPPEELRVDIDNEALKCAESWDVYSTDAADFSMRVFQKSGLSRTRTYLPRCIHPCHSHTPDPAHGAAHEEARMVMIGAVQQLMDRTGLQPADVDILVTNCSIWCPTPSPCAMLMNHFKMRSDVQSYHLSGMGCSNGVVAIGLVRDMLKARPNSRALFVVSEITSHCFYPGNLNVRRVANMIFRMGGAAVLLSNKPADRRTAKYELMHNVRVHTGADDASYRCMAWGPDAEGVLGVYLGRDVVSNASRTLELALRCVSPKIMTPRQLAAGAVNLLQQRLYGKTTVPQYVPDYTRCIDHFCIHAGGYAVLKGVQSGMSLPNAKMLPSFASLRDFGNTSCSTTWYILAYLETCEQVRRGEAVMQVGIGGGMKVGINVWRALRDISDQWHPAWRHLHGVPLTSDEMPRSIDEQRSGAAAARTQVKSAEPPGGKEHTPVTSIDVMAIAP